MKILQLFLITILSICYLTKLSAQDESTADDVKKVVETMPTFPGCEDEQDEAERNKCAQEKMLQFLYENVEYPIIARENGVEGIVIIRFIVDLSLIHI